MKLQDRKLYCFEKTDIEDKETFEFTKKYLLFSIIDSKEVKPKRKWVHLPKKAAILFQERIENLSGKIYAYFRYEKSKFTGFRYQDWIFSNTKPTKEEVEMDLETMKKMEDDNRLYEVDEDLYYELMATESQVKGFKAMIKNDFESKYNKDRAKSALETTEAKLKALKKKVKEILG